MAAHRGHGVAMTRLFPSLAVLALVATTLPARASSTDIDNDGIPDTTDTTIDGTGWCIDVTGGSRNLFSNSQSKLVFQSDGNLVLYTPGGAAWASGTNPSGYQLCFTATGTLS